MSFLSRFRAIRRQAATARSPRRRQRFHQPVITELLEPKTLLSSVSGRVFDDRTFDGLQHGEAGVAEFPVSLHTENRTLVSRILTNEVGSYEFADVDAGSYYVVFGDSLSRFQFTAETVGDDRDVDSDAIAATGQTQLFATTSGTGDIRLDAGIVPAGTAQQRALSLDTTLNLKKGRFDDFVDAFGAGEKWVKSERHPAGSEWLYILPDGRVHAWNGTPGSAEGPLIATFGADIHANPALLHYASGAGTTTAGSSPADTAYQLDQNLDLYSVGHWAESYGNLGVKWMAGRRNEFGNPWYFVTPQGRFHAWDGRQLQASGTLLAELSPAEFNDALRITNAQRPTTNPTTAVRSGLLREAFHLWQPESIPDGVPSDSGPWLRGDRHDFGNTWYFLDAAGALFAWDGTANPSGRQLAQLDASYSQNPERLAFASFILSATSPEQTAFDLNRHYQLRTTGSDFEDWAGAGEKWLAGRTNGTGNQWYFILPNGDFYKLEGRGRELGGQLLATLPLKYHDQPELLYLAFADSTAVTVPGIVGLSERDDFLTDFFFPVTIGADEGHGTHTVNVDLTMLADASDHGTAIGDVVQIYVVDQANASNTLLENGTPGSPVFSLGESWFEVAPGIARYDGDTVSISTESLPGNTNARLRFQMLNGDRDSGTQVHINSVTTQVDVTAASSVVIVTNDAAAEPGAALETAELTSTNDVAVDVQNVRFDPATGRYLADVSVVNHGPQTFDSVAVVWPGFPTDVTLSNASGTTAQGEPYLNLSDALPLGGLFPMGRSMDVQLAIDNPNLLRFLQEPIVLVDAPNTAPTLDVIPEQTIVPGEVLALRLTGHDTNGDALSYFVVSQTALPTGQQSGDTLYFAPTPNEIGVYEFEAAVSDGMAEARQTVTLNVVADVVTTTRVRGIVQNVDQEPLEGVRITIGTLETFTDADGVFFFETDSTLPDNTVRIHADELAGDVFYPFIAERLSLVLEHDVYDGALNDIERPIYLPALDVAGGSTIDPNQDVIVEQEIAPGEMAAVTVAAGSLTDQSGSDFTGVLSITEVPRDLTPAALPDQLIPDIVVTIQPGEMNFSQPARLTMPNRAGFQPGEVMDLWSINPVTGDFDVVGSGRVSDDGTQIETIDGGIRNSSWHMFIRRLVETPRDLSSDPKNETKDCTTCPPAPKVTKKTDSRGNAGSQGGAGSMMTPAGVGGAPINSEFMPGANPFSRVELPAGLDLNFPQFEFPGFDGGVASAASAPVSTGSAAGSVAGATAGLSNPFGFGIQNGNSGVGTNRISGSGIGASLNGANGHPLIENLNYDNVLGTSPVGGAPEMNVLRVGDALPPSKLPDIGSLATQFTTSEVELHSGAQIEHHDLMTYHSLGADRGLSLTYDSRRADPVHVAFMGFNNARGADGRLLLGAVDVLRGGFQGSKDTSSPGANQQTPLANRQKEHYRQVPAGTNNVELPVPIDLTSTPSGIYDYKATTGIVQANGNQTSGRTMIRDDEIVSVNSIDSPYGAGWGINGLIQLVEAPDGRVLWIDGNGGEYPYRLAAVNSDGSRSYDGPPADFSVFEKLASGRFRKTSKSGTVMDFNDQNLIASVTDRNGNQTLYDYDADGRLTTMTDPVGLETVVSYSTAGHLMSITDPVGRITSFQHDVNGNLTRVDDPDGTRREFTYNGRHHLISETDRRGNVEQIRYDDLGRVDQSIRRDLSTLQLQTVQKSDGAGRQTKSVTNAATASLATGPVATFADGNGNLETTTVDQAGLEVGKSDEEGPLPTYVRNDDNLVVQETDGRGNVTQYTYDDRGNLLTIQDQVARDSSQVPRFDASFHEPIHTFATVNGARLEAIDLDNDGNLDFVDNSGQRIISNGDGSVSISLSDTFTGAFRSVSFADFTGDGIDDWILVGVSDVFIQAGDGNGGRTQVSQTAHAAGSEVNHNHAVGDFNGDGNLDVFVWHDASGSGTSNSQSVLIGNGDGTLQPALVMNESLGLTGGASLTTADMNNDGFDDILLGRRDVVELKLSNGDGTFGDRRNVLTTSAIDGIREIVVRDIDDNGLNDVYAASGREEVWDAVANGDGTFTAMRLFEVSGRGLTEMVVGDVTGDGRDDIVVGVNDQRAAVYTSDLAGNWSRLQNVFTAGDPNELQLDDLDNDGDLDLLIRSSHVDQVSVKRNPGDGMFGRSVLTSFFEPGNGAGRGRVLFGDGNGDGVVDLFSSDPRAGSSFLTFLPGQGDAFGEPVRFATNLEQTDGMALGDIDNDGDLDAVFTGGLIHGYAVVIGNGDGTFQPGVHTNQGGNLSNPLLIDVNDDGNLDLIEAEGRILAALGNGDGTFRPLAEVFDITGGTYADIEATDFNKDGIVDLVASVGNGNPRYHVFAGHGDGTFQDVESVDPGNVGGDDIVLTDVNDDGNTDIVGYGAGRLTILLGDGVGGFSLVQNDLVGGSGHEQVAVLDIDNDGAIEVLTTDSANTQMRVFEPMGDGTYNTTFTAFRAIQGVSDFDFADTDNDGDLDVAFAGLTFDNSTSITTQINRSVEAEACDGPCRIINTYEPVFNQLTSTTDEHGRQTFFEIDPANGNTLSIRRVLGHHDGDTIVDDLLTTMTYTSRGLVETITDPLGRIVRFEYDGRGRQVRRTMAVGTANEASVITEYDNAGNVTAMVDENDNRTDLTWDTRNRVESITNALGDTTELSYDQNGNVISVNDLNGNITRTVFDEMDRPIIMIDAIGNELHLEYDEQGNLIRTVDRLNREIQFEYDKRNRLSGLINAEGGVIRYEYDFDNNLTAMTDENGHRTQYRYDARNRMVAAIDALGGTTLSNFDTVNNLTSVADEIGRTTSFVYDDADRLITMTLPDPDLDGPDTSPIYVSTYDLASNLISTVDPLGNETQMVYDNRDRLIEQAAPDPDGAGPLVSPRTQFAYDEARNLTSVSDPLGRVTQFEYDDIYRIISTTLPDPDGTGPDTSPVYVNTFDAESNLLSEVDPLGNETTYSYDRRYLLTQISGTDPDGPAGPAGNPITTFNYDDEEQLIAISDPLQRVTRFEYDRLGRNTVTILPDPDNAGPDTTPIFTSVFDPFGNVVESIDPLGNVTRFEYDALHRPLRQIDPDPDGAAGALLSPITEMTYDAAHQLRSISDPLQRVTAFDYDELGRIMTIIEPDPDKDGPESPPVSTFVYDLVGNELAMTDPLGNVTEYEYDHLYRLTKQIDTDPDGAGPLLSPEWNFTYDLANQILSQSDPLDRTTTYEYDDLGRVVVITEPDPDQDGPESSPVTRINYDLANNQRSMTDPLGNVTEYEYDNLYRMTSLIEEDPDGDTGPDQNPVWQYSYDVASQMTASTDPLDRVTKYKYDDLARIVQITEPDPDQDGPLASPVMAFAYDLVDNELSMTDSLGNVTAYEYDNLYRLVRQIDADPDGAAQPLQSPVRNYVYDVASQITSVSDPLDRTTEYEYDDLARVVTVTKPDPDEAGPLESPVMRFVYDLVDNELSMTDSLGNVTAYDYDNLYRLIQITDADPDGAAQPLASPVTSIVYDVASQMTAMTDPLNRTTQYRYDELGRRFQEIYPDPDLDGPDESPRMTYTFDLVGNVLTDTDALNHTRTFEYDNLYRPIAETDANGDPTRFEYDVIGNLLSLTDPVQNVTQWTYDDLDRVVSEVNPLNDERAFTYDSEGNLIHKVDRNGRPTEYEYDNLYRQTAEVWFDDADAEIHRFNYTYDVASQLLTAEDAFDAMTYIYDDLGRVTQKSYNITGLDPVITFNQAFDSEDNRITLAAVTGTTNDFVNTYAYDNLYRSIQISQSSATGSARANSVAEKRVDFTWDIASQRSSATRFADLAATQTVVTTDFAYDRASRITNISHAQAATDLGGYDLSWDEGNRITRWASRTDGVVDYNYDDRNQLTGAAYDFQADETYNYDENGNRSGGDHQTGLANRLAEDETYTYEYDAEGNRTRRVDRGTGEITEYDWDHRNRLVAVATRSVSGGPITQAVEHSYDAHNRWVRRRVDSDGAGSANFDNTFFIQDGNSIVLEFSGTTESDVSHRYLWGTSVDEIMADENALGDVLWPLADHLSTIRDLASHDSGTDTTTIENHKTYDAFGNVINETNAAIDTLFGYTGRAYDEATDLQNNLHRWYDSETGKWLSEDPIGFAAGDANLARYIGNATTIARDPDGRLTKVLWKLGQEGVSWAVPELGKALVDGGVVSDSVVNNIRIGRRDGQTIARPREGTPYARERTNRILAPTLHAALAQVYAKDKEIGTTGGNINLAADVLSGTVGMIGSAWYTAGLYGTGNADSQSKGRVRGFVDLALDASRRGISQRNLIEIVHRGDRISRYGALNPTRREDMVQRIFYKSILSEYFGSAARKKQAGSIISGLNQTGISTAGELEYFLRNGLFQNIDICEQTRSGNNPHARNAARLKAQIEQWRKQGYSMNMIGLLIEKRQRESQQNRSNTPMY